jgi:hypothetical protein
VYLENVAHVPPPVLFLILVLAMLILQKGMS